MQQQVDDPPSLSVGTEVSAKYKGAFCEAKVSKVVRNIKVKVAYKHGLGSGIVSDDLIKTAPGQLRVGATVEVRHPDRKENVEATVTKIQDCSQYTVVFDDGDITTLRRTALCLKSGRHFNESETLDQLPLTHPEHFGNPVVGGRRGRRRGHPNEESSDDDEESDAKEVISEKEENIGKVVCVEIESKKKDKEKWFPGLVVAPTQATVRIRVKDEYLVRSFKDGRYYTVPKKEASEFTREAAARQDGPAVQAALEYLDSNALPPHWEREALFGIDNPSTEEEPEIETDSSDDEPREEKDRFVAQLYKYMDDRGTPLNKVPSIQSRDVDLYRLFRAVQKRGGYNRVTTQNQWKPIAIRLGFTPVTVSVTNLVKQAYKKFLQPYGEFYRKLGCSMLMTPRNSNRSKGRSLVRANSVASPKPADTHKESLAHKAITAAAAATLHVNVTSTVTTTTSTTVSPLAITSTTTTTMTSVTSTSVVTVMAAPQTIVHPTIIEEAVNTIEPVAEGTKSKRKVSAGKVRSLVEKFEEKATVRDEVETPTPAKNKTVTAVTRVVEEKEKDKLKEVEISNKGLTASNVQTNSDSSPSTPHAPPNKREKLHKKPTPPTEDKRGKRKKDDVLVEKIDVGEFTVEVGDKLKVYYHEKKVTYEAKVIEIAVQRGTPIYLVHYTGWNTRYDEWVPRDRIAENLTKGGPKQKGRPCGTGNQAEKQKENPPKPPSIIPQAPIQQVSGPNCVTPTSGKGSTKRGRGRSDSGPPRSTTPSSVASNSSRTKSPATSHVKKRITRMAPNSAGRRSSANISDLSLPATETDTDSDEPVKRNRRTAKEIPYKVGRKPLPKAKLTVSTANSQSDTEEEESVAARKARARSRANSGSVGGNAVNQKGRDYDLNQIRSELKGFQRLKSPSPAGGAESSGGLNENKKDIKNIKTEPDFNYKPAVGTTDIKVKDELKGLKAKSDKIKSSSTDLSSETDSFVDEDSRSSDKAGPLAEAVAKKIHPKLSADKLRIHEKTIINKKAVAEKILKDSIVEKRHDNSKSKPIVSKEETKTIKIEAMSIGIHNKFVAESVVEEEKKSIIQSSDTKSTLIAPARFGATASKFTSVIVEKPLSVTKKAEFTSVKKPELAKKTIETPVAAAATATAAVGSQPKKFIEPINKEMLKVEPPAACSPSSSSSSSCSSSATSLSSRSLPDMSKLEISGPGTTTTIAKESKILAAHIKAPISPDIYEFKDPEPFEFEVRKSSSGNLTATNTTNSGAIATAVSSSLSAPITHAATRKQGQKSAATATQQMAVDYQVHTTTAATPISAVSNRRKRGSPMKEAHLEKAKVLKLEERNAAIVADAKLTHPVTTAPHLTFSAASSNATSIKTATQTKAIPNNLTTTNTTTSSSTITAGSSISTATISVLTTQKADTSHSQFDALRKSPSFNLNINALNEELAQTVQETTRALTDALQTTPTNNFPISDTTETLKTPVKSESAAGGSVTGKVSASPKVKTPPNAPSTTTSILVTAGSPFVETRRDPNNVFGSSSENSGVNSELKDNKFELENVKILLSVSVGAFDLPEPAKLENRPTSIADKVLKAISLKKEEVENKNRDNKSIETITTATDKGKKDDTNDAPTKDSLGSVVVKQTLPTTTTITPTSDSTTSESVITELGSHSHLRTSSSTADYPHSTASLFIDISNKKEELLGADKPIVTKHTPLTSPEPKLGILESIQVKNTDLTETIQKLECAIQRKTPVTILSTPPIITTTTNNNLSAIPQDPYTDESMDSTDSEQLVIEDTAEESTTEAQKSPVTLQQTDTKFSTGIIPVKADFGSTNSKVISSNIVSPIVPIPLRADKIQTVTSRTASPSFAGKLQANLIAGVTKIQNQHIVHTGATAGTAAYLPLALESTKKEDILNASKATVAKTQQRTSTVVPIVVPDIPASVVVASSAVPSVVAAAHAAAVALQSPESSTPPQKSVHLLNVNEQQGSPYNTPVHQVFERGQIDTSTLTTKIYSPHSKTSGYYLDSRTAFNADADDSQPISEIQEKLITKEFQSGIRAEEMVPIPAHLHGGSGDAHNESINLLCEETIPGSPAPVYAKDELLQHHQQQSGSQQDSQDSDIKLAAYSATLKMEIANATSSGSAGILPSPTTSIVQPTPNSSPGDSASQDDSADENKKLVDAENLNTPRKRRRPRNKSEAASGNSSDISAKRRKVISGNKKSNAGSDSDDSELATIEQNLMRARQQYHQQVLQIIAEQQQGSNNGIRPCPFNFLVQLDPLLTSDQSVPIVLKQIQDLRRTYNMLKNDLAAIDRRRKKLRRREREKKQLLQQQQIKI